MAKRIFKGLIASWTILWTVSCAFAVPVSLTDAKQAVQGWLREDSTLGCALGATVDESRTCETESGGSFHVVRLAEGGFVVTSTDTEDEPIVAFSEGDDLIEDEANPLWAILKRDAELRAGQRSSAAGTSRLKLAQAPSEAAQIAAEKWARLIAAGALGVRVKSAKMLSSISDVRVEPLIKSTWDQKTAGGKLCYNYYTPNNYYCGCVSTAGSQIMRYFEFPKGEVAQYENQYCTVSNRKKTLTTQGGIYEWSKMPLTPDYSITDEECQAIGKLTSDVGIACKMEYASGGSGTGGYMLSRALTKVFGYPNAVALQRIDNLPAETLRRALASNFDAGLPVALSIGGPSGGHEVVGDGYGYSGGQFYCHVNLGWSGSGNAWYAPPNIYDGRHSFTVFDGLVYNIFMDEADQGATIVSGRVLDASQQPVPGAVVKAVKNGAVIRSTLTNENGVYALRLQPEKYRRSKYVLQAEVEGVSAKLAVPVSACVATVTDDEGYYYPDTGEMMNIADADLVLGTVDLDLPEEEELPLPGAEKVPDSAPEGDYFAKPIVLSGDSGIFEIPDTSAYSIEYVNVENGLFPAVPMARSAWLQWKAPGTGTVTFEASSQDANGNKFPTMIAAYCGQSYFTLDPIASFTTLSANQGSSITFEALQGATYRIVVFANGNTFIGGRTSGPYRLTWSGELVEEQERPEALSVLPGTPVYVQAASEEEAKQLGQIVIADESAAEAGQSLVLKLTATPSESSGGWVLQVEIDQEKIVPLDDTVAALGKALSTLSLQSKTRAGTTSIEIPAESVTSGLYYSVCYADSPDFKTSLESPRKLAKPGESLVLEIPADNAPARFFRVKASMTSTGE